MPPSGAGCAEARPGVISPLSQTCTDSVAVFIDGSYDMFTGEAKISALMDESGGDDVLVVEMPEDLLEGCGARLPR